ncbi:MAG: hypothetical protein EBW76_07785, partial [Actinobacteria bacterium]|nr:hypothetical protein [Actinomycetota bacterium]
YFRDPECTAAAVYSTGWTGWDENQPQPLINAYFTNSYYADSHVYQVTGPIITLSTIYYHDGSSCTPSDGLYEVLKATKYSDISVPASYGKFTIGP